MSSPTARVRKTRSCSARGARPLRSVRATRDGWRCAKSRRGARLGGENENVSTAALDEIARVGRGVQTSQLQGRSRPNM